MKKTTYFWKKGLWALLSFCFLILILFSGLYIYVDSQLPAVDSLKTVKLQVPLRIYSQEGLLIQEYGEKRRIPLAYEQIPPTLVHALLATEDQRFFDHPGVDVFGLARATVRMVQTGTKSQGGSTITMQVARNFFLNRKKTFLRKFNEIMLAIKIDHQLSKEKILELYLNKIYLGNRAYGVGAAAQIYYGKTIQELNLAELAMIAGLPQAPSTQNPIVNPKAAKKRRDHVLARLLEDHYITQQEFTNAIKQPVKTHYHGANIEVNAPYVAEMIRQSLYSHFGESAYTKGYKVYTTIQAPFQNAANQLIEQHLLAYDKRHGYRGPVAKLNAQQLNDVESIHKALKIYPVINDLEPAVICTVEHLAANAQTASGNLITLPWTGLSWARPALKKGWVGTSPKTAAQVVSVGDVVYVRKQQDTWELIQIPEAESALVALDPNNGAIKTLVGGLSFQKSKFNRATQSGRQPGSSFKPFIYAAALNKGYNLATLVNDAPIVVDDPSQANAWRPHNDNQTFDGPTRLKDALVHSRNLVSIRILDDIGIDYTIDFVSHFGFDKNTLPHALSLALGSLSTSPMDLTAAYAVFANGGFKIEPFLIDHMTTSDGHILLQAKPSRAMPRLPDNKSTNLDADTLAPRIIPEDIAFLMNSALMGVIQQGTAHEASVLKRNDIAGKTGTTNDQVDAWFAGYNPNLVATAWIGFDTPHPLHEYAAQLALPLWIDFMKVALHNKPVVEIPKPDNIITAQINPINGLVASKQNAKTITEYFTKNDVPDAEESSGDTDTLASNERSNHSPYQSTPTQESLF